MNNERTTKSAFLYLRALIPLLLGIATVGTLLGFLRPEASTNNSQRTLTFAERVAYQRAIEDIYWRHRIWPKENLNPKPSLDAVMSQAQLEKKVEDYLRSTQALQDYWQRPITAEDLQAEIDRLARDTKEPEVLRELFEALGNDPFVIAECLARPTLVERDFAVAESRTASLEESRAEMQTKRRYVPNANYRLPTISDAATGCAPDTWTATSTNNAPQARADHTAVWTGSEMIVWGGTGTGAVLLNTGGRYNPSTDSWVATSTTNAPTAREAYTAVWTGIEMIVWGGSSNPGFENTGGRYNPGTNSWTATSTTNAPDGRFFHTAVWTDSEMIVWGGNVEGVGESNTGGRYNPSTDSWTVTSTANAPPAREQHTAVWTGSEMIVWGGEGESPVLLHTGGRYNPSTDTWTATSLTNTPDGRIYHTAIWIGSEMVVWGGIDFSNVWGGYDGNNVVNTGGRYNPGTDSWTATTTTNAPAGRDQHTAIWTESEMIVWGGVSNSGFENTGGRYCAQFTVPSPTPTATATPTPTSTPTATATATLTATVTPTARPTPTPRSAPTPRLRPTPAPRP